MCIESWDEFSKKDSSLQTIAFKSKTVNKPLVNKKNKKAMNECENILKFNDFDKNDKVEETKKDEKLSKITEGPEKSNQKKNITSERPKAMPAPQKSKSKTKTIIKEYLEFDSEREEIIDLIFNSTEVERDFLEELSDDELEEILNNIELDNDGEIQNEIEDIDELSSDDDLPYRAINDKEIKTFESFSVKPAPKEEKQPEYTILGKENEPASNPNFGIGAVKAQQIKKITDFNVIDPATPKERTIGGNAGVYIDNDIMSGRLNRIEGKNVYIESPDDPLTIKKFSLKDAVKLKK